MKNIVNAVSFNTCCSFMQAVTVGVLVSFLQYLIFLVKLGIFLQHLIFLIIKQGILCSDPTE